MKIYNVKMVKTEMARGPPKHCQNQKSFWIPSNYPQVDAWRVGLILFFEKVFFGTPHSLYIYR